MRGGTLPGADDTEEPRVVVHVDMDCFYASCERRRDPSLRGEPVVVGMGFEPGESHGAVATASYEARKFGVESAQPISQALEALPPVNVDDDGRDGDDGNDRRDGNDGHDDTPTGFYLPVDMSYYKSVAREVKAVLHDCADVVREVSIDEAYLDVTDRTAWDVVDDRPLAEGYGRYVKQRIAREVGVPASVGVAPDMATAKVASDHDKPDGLVAVPPGSVRAFLAPLPIEEIHGVGPVTAQSLRERGIDTAGDLAAADPATMREQFGERGVDLARRARGDDARPVEPTGRPKSLSRESAFTEATDDDERIREKVRTLAGDVATRASERDALYRTIGVKVVTPPYEIHTRERSLPGPIDDPELLEEVALDLLEEFAGERVRKLGVRVSNLAFSGTEQRRLDGYDAVDAASGGAAERIRTGKRRSGGRGQIPLSEFEPDDS